METKEISQVRIAARLAALKKQRDDFVTQANLEIAAFNGAIQIAEELLKPEPKPDAAPVTAGEVLPAQTAAGKHKKAAKADKGETK